MRKFLALSALTLAAVASSGGEAKACFFLGIVGEDNSEPARLRRSREAVQRRSIAARQALSGGIDIAAELAEMLVPNIRPTRIESSDCGPINEVDYGAGEETVEDWLSGTRLAGRSLGDEFVMVNRTYRGATIGPACNMEFRSRFAGYLRERLSPRQMRDSYLFLAARWERGDVNIAVPRTRLLIFERDTRRPPLRWRGRDFWQEAQLQAWTRRSQTGRALQRVMDEFWRDSTPLLDDLSTACPAAAARWPTEQQRIVALIEERLARIEQRRAARRTQQQR